MSRFSYKVYLQSGLTGSLWPKFLQVCAKSMAEVSSSLCSMAEVSSSLCRMIEVDWQALFNSFFSIVQRSHKNSKGKATCVQRQAPFDHVHS